MNYLRDALDDLGMAMASQNLAKRPEFLVRMGDIAFDALLCEVDLRWNPFTAKETQYPPGTEKPREITLYLSAGKFRIYKSGYCSYSIEITPE